jgi:cyclomaltodextrinase
VKALKAITQRLPEIKKLGANIIWLQPITPPFEEDGHGYDVVEYKKVWPVLGSHQDLKNMVKTAHALGIRVMLDVVLNHSSTEHPFVKDIAKKGKSSRYYDFYQHEPIAQVPYAQHFNQKNIGRGEFIFYFWEHLVNFNYQNPKLREYMLDVLAFWMREFNVDGFRFDASWGPSSRWPGFYQMISRNLRQINPHVILMAEDMIGYPVHYQGTGHPHLKGSGFNWAYDWNNRDPYWISKWAFQTGEDQGETIFNLGSAEEAAKMFVSALKESLKTEGILPVRYLENNDTPGFLRNHGLKDSKFASSIMFVLPGVPLIFYGQEAGNTHSLFELPSFDPDIAMSSLKPSLWKHYQKLISMRRSSLPLALGNLEGLKIVNKTKVIFSRSYQKDIVQVEVDFAQKTVKLN